MYEEDFFFLFVWGAVTVIAGMLLILVLEDEPNAKPNSDTRICIVDDNVIVKFHSDKPVVCPYKVEFVDSEK